MSHFFAYLSRMKNIKRWGLMRNTQEENIKEHSLDVAVVAHALAVIRNTFYGGALDVGYVTELAVFHEVGEVITGDLATPIKYFNPEISRVFKDVEHMAEDRLLDMLPGDLKPVYEKLIHHEGKEAYAVVKAADKLCAYIKCVEETKSGNMEFEKARNKIAADLAAIKLPEVGYFMREFLPSYALTLDELN